MKVGDTVRMSNDRSGCTMWHRVGLVLGYSRDMESGYGMVLVFWGEDFPCEEEYPEQLQVV
jgi:hypothetical protein